ncbi:hypothetical protein CJU90_4987 [Yarrowia sp. C11]|nr:hypothetical protein CJU90_4987 [Yarrowia sp. C11]
MLQAIPYELALAILHNLDQLSDLLAVYNTSQRLRQVASDETLWKPHLNKRYRAENRPEASGDFRDEMLRRLNTESVILNVLDRILDSSESEWMNHFKMAFNLGKMCVYPLTQVAQTHDNICARWTAMQLLHSMKHCAGITRLTSVNSKQLMKGGDVTRVFAMFHCFTESYLGHNLAENCDYIDFPALQGISATDEDPTRVLLEQLLVANAELCGVPPRNTYTTDFRSLSNHYIHDILNKDNVYGIPLTRAIIFCKYCSDYGLEAHPLLFPSEVLVRVNEKGTGSRFFVVDVYRRNRILTHSEVLALVPENEDVGAPTLRDTLVRSMMNLQASLEVNVRRGVPSPTECYYLMYTLMAAFMPQHMDSTRKTQLQVFLRKFYPLDVLVMLKDINRVFATDSTEVTLLEQLDPVLRTVKPRGPESKHVKYLVGQVVHHTRLDLYGIVVSWFGNSETAYEETAQIPNREIDVGMEESEAYYHVVVDGVGEKRVFAESNLVVVDKHSGVDVMETFSHLYGLCLMFQRFDKEEFRFEMTDVMKKCYPGDIKA